MPAGWPKAVWDQSEGDLFRQSIAPLNDALDRSWQQLQDSASGLARDAASAASSLLPKPADLFPEAPAAPSPSAPDRITLAPWNTRGPDIPVGGLPDPGRLFGAPSAPTAAARQPAGAPAQTGDLRSYTRAKATSLGIDPDIAVRVAESEGGFDDPVRQSDVVYQGRREESYGPFQLNVRGGLGAEAIRRGHDPRDPANVYRNIDFALEQAQSGGWGPYHGAARVGIGPRQGIGVAPVGPAPAVPTTTSPSAMPPIGTYTKDVLSPFDVNQITQGQAEGLTAEEALAVCGPAATLAFAKSNGGRMPTLREAKELGERLGVWNVGQGMAGPASEVKLLEAMGVPATLQQGVDWAAVAREVQAGRPVILDSPGHYWVVTGADSRTGEFEFGQSAAVLRKSGGKTRWRPDQIPSLGMGDIRATILLGRR